MSVTYKNAKGVTYYLHGKTRTLKSGKQQTLYFFAKAPGAGALNEIPQGYMISESKTGLPFLKRK